MDEDAKLLFPDLTSSSTGASQQVLHDVSLNASPPGRSGLNIDPSIQVVGADKKIPKWTYSMINEKDLEQI